MRDPCKPFQYWFQQTPVGLTLFTIFYCQACRWKRCTGCNLHLQMSEEHIDYRYLMAQVDYLFNMPHVIDWADDIRKMIVSNNGSVLDEETFSTTALIYLVAMTNAHLPKLQVFTLESRPEHVDWEELEVISRAMHEGSMETLEIAVGFEIFDDHLRNKVFQKGLTKPSFERFVTTVQKHSASKEHDYAIKVYFMLKPVAGMSDEEAIADIHAAIVYLSSLERSCDVEINLHLNPTFVAKGTALEIAFVGETYTPPTLRDLARAAVRAKNEPITVFLGLNDEGLAVEGGSFIRPGDEPVLEKLSEFNATQDYRILEEVADG